MSLTDRSPLLLSLVLPFPLFEVFRSIDEQDVVRLLTAFEHEDANRNPGRVEEACGQADHCVDESVLQQFRSDTFFCTTPEEHSVGQDDGHHTFVFEIVEAVQQERKVGCRPGSEAMTL